MADFDLFGGDFNLGGFGDSGTGSSSFPSGLNLGGAEAPAAATQGLSLGVPPLSMPDVNMGDAAAPPSTGFGDIAKSVGAGAKEAAGDLGSFAKGALPFAQLGMAGFGMSNALAGQGAARQQGQILKRQQENQQRATAPLVAFGENQLQQATAGHVDPAIQASIDGWKQGAKQQIIDWFARHGIADSTMIQSRLAEIDRQGEAMKAEMIQRQEQGGVTALTSAAGAATQGAQTAQTEQSQLDTLLKEANAALASLSGQQ